MPYIKQENRDTLEVAISDLLDHIKLYDLEDREDREGVLNYVFTKIILNSMKSEDRWRYKNINRMVGILECCKLELYRRLGSSVEDTAINNNNDLEEYHGR